MYVLDYKDEDSNVKHAFHIYVSINLHSYVKTSFYSNLMEISKFLVFSN